MLAEARKEQLLFTWLHDELVIYDVERRQYHHLNPTAALVWTNCDGRKTVPDLTDIVRKDISPEADEETVWSALLQLKEIGLLTGAEFPDEAASRSRREFLHKTALAGGSALFAAAISTLVAPTVAQAQSNCSTCQCW
jgi:hypothetical protein